MDDNIVTIVTEDGEELKFEVLGRTKLFGTNYLLVCDNETDEAYIMKEAGDENNDVILEFVEDDKELDAVSACFASELDDIELK